MRVPVTTFIGREYDASKRVHTPRTLWMTMKREGGRLLGNHPREIRNGHSVAGVPVVESLPQQK